MALTGTLAVHFAAALLGSFLRRLQAHSDFDLGGGGGGETVKADIKIDQKKGKVN